MKTFRLILAFAAVALTAVSCVEKSGKYQTLLAQRDSLLTVEQKYDQTLEILNEIETGFQSIREVEDRVMTQISDIENKPLDKKQQMVSQINQIKGILLQNKERIAELEAQFAQSGRKNASLAGTIKRLQEEMTRKVAQIESLQTELSQKHRDRGARRYGRGAQQTLEILNEIETGFQSIREVEDRVMTQISDIENKPLDKKQQMVSQINQIKGILLQNKERIAELEAQFAQSGRKNASLAGTIKRLQEEMTRKVAQIESLQTELSQKNIEIEELAGTVEELNKDIAGLNEVTASQKTTIEEQDSQLNVVWFCIADMKQLKEARIVEGNGLFKTKSIMDGDFDKSAFTSADLRNLTRIETGSKKPKLLTSHPKESYTLTPGEDKLVTLEITDPAKFWSISKYLVIRK